MQERVDGKRKVTVSIQFFANAMEDNEYNVMGIDFGTTNTRVAVWKNGQIELVPNEGGNRLTPSVVSFTESEILIGDGANNKCITNPKNTITDVKRLMGKKISDMRVQYDIRFWPFTVTSDATDNPVIQVEHSPSGKTQYTPEEICSLILKYLQKQVENYCGRPVRDAVIAVPAYASDSEKESIQKAAKLAGLNVLRLLDEPIAAALAYNYAKNDGSKKILVYDLGGRSFDVSALEFSDSRIHVICSVGDSSIGGENFNSVLMEFLFEQYKKQKGEDISHDPQWRARMRRAVESCKVDLSLRTSAPVEFDNSDFSYSVPRFLFENLNRGVFQQTIDIVRETLQKAGFQKEEVSEVILVGGSTKIPRVQQLIKDTFPSATLCKELNPEETIALGAVIMAVMTKLEMMKQVPSAALLSVGLETQGGITEVMIPRGTQLPVTMACEFTIPTDYQSAIEFKLVMGERLLASDNVTIGSICIPDLPLAKTEETTVSVRMSLSSSHMLHVEVSVNQAVRREEKDISLGRDNPLSPLLLSEEELSAQIREAEEKRGEDEEKVRRCEARNRLECAIEQGYGLIHTPTASMTSVWILQARTELDSARKWMKLNTDVDCPTCERRLEELRQALRI